MKWLLHYILLLFGTASVAAQDPNAAALSFDFPAVHIGVAEDEAGPTGTTVFYFPEAVKGAIDVRGGDPGTINASVLHNSREAALIDAVVFSGGSWYGLSAATGAADAIKDLKAAGGARDYIAGVVGAIIYDVGARRFSRVTPDHNLGAAALRAAEPGRFPLGARGAGRFTMQGWYYGPYYHTGPATDAPAAVHSGQGGAFRQIGPTKVAVFTVVNPLGTIVDREGRIVRCHRNDSTVECPLIADRISQSLSEAVRSVEASDSPTPNTTITLVLTNQQLEFSLLRRLAMQVHTSMGRAIQPFATQYDGDVLVAVTTDEVDNPDLSATALGMVASELAWDAVLRSVPELPPVPELATNPPDAETLGAYVGTYAFPGDSRLTVALQGGALSATYSGATTMYFDKEQAYMLIPGEGGSFLVDSPDRDVIRFDMRDEVVTGLTLNPGPWAQPANRIGSEQE